MQKKWGITRIAKALGFAKSNPKRGRHNCEATLKKVMLALDNELSTDEEKALLEEVKSCSYCLQKFEIEKSFKEYLCEKIKRHSIPANITEQIRARIRSTMDH